MPLDTGQHRLPLVFTLIADDCRLRLPEARGAHRCPRIDVANLAVRHYINVRRHQAHPGVRSFGLQLVLVFPAHVLQKDKLQDVMFCLDIEQFCGFDGPQEDLDRYADVSCALFLC